MRSLSLPRPALRNLMVSLLLSTVALMGLRCPFEELLLVGVCKRDITPVSPGLVAAYEAKFGGTAVVNHTDPVYLAGFGNDRQATGYNDQLWARGLVLQGRGGRIAIVSVDLIGYFNAEVNTIRALVDPESDIDYLALSSTHQHEGPDTLGIWGADQVTSGLDPGYIDFVNASVANCVDEAADNLKLGRIKFATTDSVGLSLGIDAEDDGEGVADSRVLVDDDLIAPATEGRITDPRLSILQVTERRWPRRPLATLVNFASHPESLGSNNTLVTSDFPHYAREAIEASVGGTAIWVSGDLGVLQGPLDIDVEDPDTGQPAVRRTFRWAEVHGQQLAERVVSAIPHKKGKARVHLEYASDPAVPVRLDNPFFRFFIATGVLPSDGLYTNGVPDASVGFPFPPPFDPIPQALGEDIQTEVGVFRINEASFAVVPTELDPQIGEVYRDAMVGAEHTFILGLGNDEIGYQLPAEKFDPSCETCAPFILAGATELCPLFPNIDCNTVFQNNVGVEVDPTISGAILPLIDDLHD
ncbi:MAG: neutral/alkaline non-lysosomal ceramidase N-terminal domain-containing protein [Myxococcota bacterium]